MLLFDHKVTKNKWKYQHLCPAISSLMSSYRVRCPIGLRSVSDRIASAARSDCVRCPIGLRSVHDERVWGGIHQKSHFYSFLPIHFGSTMVPITRNG